LHLPASRRPRVRRQRRAALRPDARAADAHPRRGDRGRARPLPGGLSDGGHHEPRLPPPPPPPELPPEKLELLELELLLEPPLLPDDAGAVWLARIAGAWRGMISGEASNVACGGMLARSSALPQASASPSATAHPLYSRSTPRSHAHWTCWPSLAWRNRRNDSVRSASAEPSALRAGSSPRYAIHATAAGSSTPSGAAPHHVPNQPSRRVNRATIHGPVQATSTTHPGHGIDPARLLGGSRFHHPLD